MDLFKDITIPDLRDKETIKKAGNSTESKKLAKAMLTLTQLPDIQTVLFNYEKEAEALDKIYASRMPAFRFIPPSREVVQRLIVRATTEKELF